MHSYMASSSQVRNTCLQEGTNYLLPCPCIPNQAHRSRRRSYMRVSAAQRCTWSTPSSASSLAAWMAQSKYDLRQGRAGRVVRHGECSRAAGAWTTHAGRSVHACSGVGGPGWTPDPASMARRAAKQCRALHACMHLPCPQQQVHGAESRHMRHAMRRAGRHGTCEQQQQQHVTATPAPAPDGSRMPKVCQSPRPPRDLYLTSA